MEHTYTATTIENDAQGFEDLQQQLLNRTSQVNEKKEEKAAKPQPTQKVEKQEKEPSNFKKNIFKKGDQTVELDEDHEIEFMADKKLTKLSLRELKERAAGDIAVKNRMHSLAEEKKRVQTTFKQFSDLAKTDPLAALEYISQKAKETDSEFEYTKYLEKLAEQAEKLGQMTEEQRKAWELEKKLNKAEQDLSHKERVEAVVLRKQELLGEYPEIGDQQFGQMVQAVLSSDELMEGLENEDQVMDKVEDLIIETMIQKDLIQVIREVNPDHIQDTDLIFSLSNQIRQNPDLDEGDVRDIVQDIIGKPKVQKNNLKVTDAASRQKDIKTLSRKAREGTPESSLKTQNASPYDLLYQQIMESKNSIRKTPITMR